MRQWDLTTSAAQLELGLQALQMVRGEVESHWNDTVSRRFQEQFLDPLEPKIKRMLDAIHRLGQMLAEAQRECDPP